MVKLRKVYRGLGGLLKRYGNVFSVIILLPFSFYAFYCRFNVILPAIFHRLCIHNLLYLGYMYSIYAWKYSNVHVIVFTTAETPNVKYDPHRPIAMMRKVL